MDLHIHVHVVTELKMADIGNNCVLSLHGLMCNVRDIVYDLCSWGNKAHEWKISLCIALYVMQYLTICTTATYDPITLVCPKVSCLSLVVLWICMIVLYCKYW